MQFTQSYTKSQFVSEYDRVYPDDFSREALELLYEHLNSLGIDWNSLEFGTINDNYCEQDLEDCLKDYNLEGEVDVDGTEDEDEKEEKVQQAIEAYLEHRTELVGFTSSQSVVYAFNFE